VHPFSVDARAVRQVIAGLLLLTALVVLAVETSHGVARAADPSRPNIMVIVSDDQRIGTVNATDPVTGGAWMPAVKRWLGQDGTEYAQAFVSSPNCCPSRASIFTGQYPHNHGVESEIDRPDLGGLNRGGTLLQNNAYTLQRYLQDAGYYSGIYGKYLNDFILAHGAEPPAHFNEWGIFDSGYGKYYNCTPGIPSANDCQIHVSEGSGGSGQQAAYPEYSTTYVRQNAVNFLLNRHAAQQNGDARPWFLYVAPYGPHPPAQPEDAYGNTQVPDPNYTTTPPSYLEPDLSDKPQYVQGKYCCAKVPGNLNTPDSIKKIRTNQFRALKSVDDLVNSLFATLWVDGDLTNTLVIYVSDNGYVWGEHYIEGKLNPYLESIRVPMYMRWPGHVQANFVNNAPYVASNIDITPTIVQELSIPLPSGAPTTDGKDILGADPARPRWFSEYTQMTDFNSATTTAYEVPPSWATEVTPSEQYIEIYAADGTVTDREYYNLISDPYELNNLLKDGNPNNDSDANTLTQQLAQDRNCSGRLGKEVVGRSPCP
jgi:arylsulfatase A-like enzyme